MRQNFWLPEKIDLTQDVTDYANLTESEKRAYNGILSYLTFLDSVQTCNLPHIKSPITAPEVNLCISEQISQEAMHNASYQYVIETVIPSHQRNDIYNMWRNDAVLKHRCEYISCIYQDYINNPTEENYFYALVADYILESIYFYNGFMFYYGLASRMLMSGTADMFKLINRDELSHVRLYQKLIPEAMNTFSFSEDKVYELFSEAVELEINWTNHIIGDDILGIDRDSTDIYTKYLANIRLKAIGLNHLYSEAKYRKNPYKHLENISDTEDKATTKANFFESGVTSYSMSNSIGGWNDF